MMIFAKINRLMLLLTILSLNVLVSCTEQLSPVLKIGTNVWLGYEPLYLARNKQFIDPKKAHLVEFSSASQVIQAFRNEVIDAAAITLDEALLLAQSGEQLTVILVLDISNGADAIISQANITRMTDLQGKLIGVEASTVGSFMLHRALTVMQLKDDAFSTIMLDVNEHEQAFLNHKIDALVTFEPVRSKLIKQGANVLFDSSQIPNEIIDVLVVRNSYLKKHQAYVQHLLNGWYKALTFFKQSPKAAAEIMSKRLQLSTAETLNSFSGLILPNAEQNKRLLQQKPVPELLIIIKKITKLMVQHKLLTKGEQSLLKLNENSLQHQQNSE
jgi:NitT/TauT family transport system substrate-binding protein